MNWPQVYVLPFTFSYKKEYVQWFFIAVSSESKSICHVTPPVKREMKLEWTLAISSNCFQVDSGKLCGVRLFLCFHRAEIMAFPLCQLEWSCCVADPQQRQTDILPLVQSTESWPGITTQSLPNVFLSIMGRWK